MIKDEWIARSLGERSSSPPASPERSRWRAGEALLKGSDPQAKRSSIINHIGPSMNPTLKSGDVLQVIPYDGKKVRRGDVIVFLSPENGHIITHRVISVDSQGIKTRGDNNNQVDPLILTPDHILGHVVCAKRRDRRRKIFGGSIGRLFAGAIRAIHVIDESVSSLLRPVYHRLARSGVFRGLLPGRMEPRVLSFNRPGGTELQLLMGRRVIGRWLPGRDRWRIRRPFRLFVDEAKLPENACKFKL
jgi:hypothetical protein